MTPLTAREVWPQNKVLKGIPASPGIVIGPAYVISDKNKVHINHIYLASFPQVTQEIERFRDAVLANPPGNYHYQKLHIR